MKLISWEQKFGYNQTLPVLYDMILSNQRVIHKVSMRRRNIREMMKVTYNHSVISSSSLLELVSELYSIGEVKECRFLVNGLK